MSHSKSKIPNSKSSFPRYERYKDSGVEWLGEIPEHWEAVPNRALLTEQREKVGKDAPDFLLLSLTLKGVIPRNMENPQGKFPAEFNTYTIVKPDDLVFCLFDIDETPRAVGHARHHGMITGAYNVYSPTEKINPGYLFYYYLFLDANKRLKPLYTGLRKTIQRGVFGSAKAPLPPKPEQDRIVAFLDQKTAEIDALIAKKKRQIELLDEQKAILINRAVTRGLNPNAKLKPSGIEWIGEIPEHWEVKKLRVILHAFSTRGSPNARLLSVTRELGVIERNVESKEENHNFVPDDLTNYKVIEKGDFVINKMKAWQGSFAVTPLDGIVSPAYFTFRVRHVSTDFFHVAIRSKQYVPFFAAASDGVRIGQWDLVPARMREIQFVIPPVSEQTAIAEVVEKIKMDTASLILKIESQIESLKTLRSTLIAHAVIGKIKV